MFSLNQGTITISTASAASLDSTSQSFCILFEYFQTIGTAYPVLAVPYKDFMILFSPLFSASKINKGPKCSQPPKWVLNPVEVLLSIKCHKAKTSASTSVTVGHDNHICNSTSHCWEPNYNSNLCPRSERENPSSMEIDGNSHVKAWYFKWRLRDSNELLEVDI